MPSDPSSRPIPQIFRTKSIDKLIAESEKPQHALKKTLGPVSLTALGIGAVIGSGIFTVIGTAIAGEKFDTSSILHAPVADYLIYHSALAGRPGAGPALALSLVLVAIICALTGLCYAELASMIPIAGSAYTYSYATLGELVAWIIGWDLILEYAGSNMSVSVGFAAHVVDLLDWFGIHPSARWISPAYLPGGLQDLAGHDIYSAGWHFGFNIPAFLIVLLLTIVLVRGVRESARTNNIMVLIKLGAILLFLAAGSEFIKPRLYHPFAPNGWSGILTGGSIIFFTYIGFDSVSTASEECRNPQRDVPIGILATLIICTILYIGVAVGAHGHRAVADPLQDDGAPVVTALKTPLRLTPEGHSPALGPSCIVLLGAIVGMISSILVFQLRTGARVVCHVAATASFPTCSRPRAAQSSAHRPSRRGSRAFSSPSPPASSTSAPSPRCRTSARSLPSCSSPSASSCCATKTPTAARKLPRALRPGHPGTEHPVLHPAHGRPPHHHLAPLLRLACPRPGRLRLLQPQTQ